MKNYLQKRPWIWIVFGFCVLVAALACMVTIAVKNLPKEVPLAAGAASYADH
jgi:hypothetical protein